MRDEYLAAHEIVRHWQRRVAVVPPANEHTYLALLFMMLRTPDPLNDCQQQDQRLRQAITQLVDRFRQLAGLRFSDERGLTAQLYTHIAQALDRNLFGIGIDNSLQEEIERLYPRLIRTTREALVDLETEYALRFSAEEAGLVAVIFGAWLMQDAELQEKQVVLITGHEPQREQEIELQLRELTLLPLNIKYQSVREFQKQGAPRGVTLIVTPYAIPLPLFSAPLIHSDQTLTDHQQLHIRAMLES